LADFKEKTHGLRSRITTALMYPAVLCVIGTAVSIFLMTYVVPNLLDTLAQAGKELPPLTRTVKGVSDLLVRWWWALLAGAACAAIGLKLMLRVEAVRAALDRALLRIPVVGDLIRRESISRMAVMLSSLLRSGLPFIEAVGITRGTMRNSVFRRAMDEYERAVTAGSDIASSLAETGAFGPMVVQMLAVGQQTGELEDMLEQLAATYDRQVDTATKRLTTLIEPLLIVLLAVLVGTIALATILPILEASNVL